MSKDILRDLRGFGTVEKWVLTDPKLHASAKGLYALLCAYAGDKGQAFPGTDLLRHQMGLSKNTLHKYIKQLEGFGVIKVDQLRADGKFSRNIYTLLPQGYAVSQKLGSHKMSSQKMGSQDLDTNNNSLNKNSSKSNSNKEEEAKASLSSSDDPQSTTAEMSFADQCRIIIEKWNSVAPLPIKLITPDTTRAKQLKARIKAYSIDGVLEAIDLVASSQFLQGDNKQNWVITFDWFIKPSNFQKVFEGNYTRERVVRNEISNRSNQRTETKMERARRVQRELIEQLERYPAQATNKDVVFHD